VPRRNLTAILLVAALSLACYARVDQGHYGPKLQEILRHIHDDGLYTTDRRELFEAAARAMAENLDDENTQFFTAEERDRLNQSLEQQLHGIGAHLEPYKGRPRVRHVLFDQPAAKAGLLPGDIVLAVDGVDTLSFKKLDDFIKRVKGNAGEPVKLSIQRGADQTLEFTVVRAVVSIESIKGYVRRADGSWDYAIPDAPNIAYIRIEDSFGSKTFDELTTALETIHDEGFAGLILDLRNNRGGRLDAAEQICNLFLPADKVILTTRGRDKAKILETYRSDGSGAYQDIPLAVIINKHSASASEIVAGCLKDHGRAVVVGERSFGKGTVQRLYDVDGGRSMLKLTTASFWTPSEQRIHRSAEHGGKDRDEADESVEWGIRPSEGYEVVIDDKDIVRLVRHFDKLDFAAIEGEHALVEDMSADEEPSPIETDEQGNETEPSSTSPKSPPDENAGVDSQKPTAQPDEPPLDQPPAADKKAAETGPFVDLQLRRAVEAVEQRIKEAARRRAA
jgi:carboxyl-terminal processing protease